MENNEYTKKLMQRFKHPKFVKKLKNPNGIGEVGNINCLLPQEKIVLNGDYQEIKNTKEGDLVFSHDLKENKIVKRFSRKHSGKIIKLKNTLGEISLTPEHLVYSIVLPNKRKFKSNKGKKELIPAWYHCEDLKKGDIILYPINSYKQDQRFLNIDLPKSKWDFNSPNLPKRVPLEEDLLRLFGYFLAEGNIQEKPSRNFISFSLNINEEDIAKDIQKICRKLFNLEVTIRKEEKRNVLIVFIYNSQLSRIFKQLFGNGAQNKKIPKLVMDLPIKKQESLVYGMWKGDGYININRTGPRAGYSTISYNLIQQLKLLLLRQGIIPSIYEEKEKKVKGINHKKSYRIHVGQRDSLIKIANLLNINYYPKSYKSINSWIEENYLYTPITQVKRKIYSGDVFNLEVENAHSFTSEAFLVHNCGDIMHLEIDVDDKTQKIKDIGFKTFGCGAAIASSDIVCELAKGKTIKEAKKLNKDQVVKKLGGMPPIKVHCSILGIEALNKAIDNYKNSKKEVKNGK